MLNVPMFNVQEAAQLDKNIVKDHDYYKNRCYITTLPYDEMIVFFKPFLGREDIAFVKLKKAIFNGAWNTDYSVNATIYLQEENKGAFYYLSDSAFPWIERSKAHIPMCITRMNGVFDRVTGGTSAVEEDTENILTRLLFCLTIMNCKNIKYVDYDPNKGIPWRNQKSTKKKPKPPFVRYKILEIQPMAQRTQAYSVPHEAESAQRLHTVRGHFKTYTAEHPLFGKYAGTYWWGNCIKGNAEFGLNEKDYHIKIDSTIFSRKDEAVYGKDNC